MFTNRNTPPITTAQVFKPEKASEPTSKIELSLSCKNLLDFDIFTNTHPICVVYMKTVEDLEWSEVGRTECVDNTLNPNFITKICIMYFFEVQQLIKFKIFDIDLRIIDLESQDFLGSCETTLGHLITSVDVTLPLTGIMSTNKGLITVQSNELSTYRDEVTLYFNGINLEQTTWMSKLFSGFLKVYSFFEIYKFGLDGLYKLVYRSEAVNWTNHPTWKPLNLQVRLLCGTNYNRVIKIACFRYNSNGNHSLMGEFYTSMNQLKNGPGPDNEHKCIKPVTYEVYGCIRLNHFILEKNYTFLDYIVNGSHINCSFAIDFTASNGDPREYDSLHYVCSKPNQYEQAFTALGDIIQDYTSNKMFPALGFGAIIPSNKDVCHDFFLNLEANDPYCAGVEGVISAYRHCVANVQLHDSTNFSAVINHVARFARTCQDGSQYFILLIITDGVVTDILDTKQVLQFIQAIGRASALPMSIIIVGVGNEDFSIMKELITDPALLDVRDKHTVRNIIQFVEFKEFYSHDSPPTSKIKLAREVLAEIPDQFLSYMKSRKLIPKNQNLKEHKV